jgi:hypothetical protein
MFKKIGLFLFAVGLAAGAYAAGSPECYNACSEELDACTDSGGHWYDCRADFFACKKVCDAQ